MTLRHIDPNADASGSGHGYFGLGKYLPVQGLEVAHFFGTNYPDPRFAGGWDYACNDRIAKGGANRQPTCMKGGVFDLDLSPADLGVTPTIWALVKRDAAAGSGNDAFYMNSQDGRGSNALSIGASASTSNYLAIVNGTPGSVLVTLVLAPMTAFTGSGYELVLLTIDGSGGGALHVQRPSGQASGKGLIAANTLPVNLTYGAGRFRVGGSWNGSTPFGDDVVAVGAYSRHFGDADVASLFAGLKSFGTKWGGIAL